MTISALDRHVLQLCIKVREESHDPDRKVGVVITNSAGEVLTSGTNAPPRALGFTKAQSRRAIRQDFAWKYFMLEHAERNAIFRAHAEGKTLTGSTIYTTLFPCADCARAIVAAGISRVVVLGQENNPERDKKWLEHYERAKQIFFLAGMIVEIAS